MKQRFLLLARITLYLLPALAAGLIVNATHRAEAELRSPLPVAPTLPYDSTLTRLAAPGDTPLEIAAADVPEGFHLRRGQTLNGLLLELGLDRREAYNAVAAAQEYLDVRKIRAGENGNAYLDTSGQLVRLRLAIAGKGRLELARAAGGWTSAWSESVRQVEVRRIHGELDSFLIEDVREAGGHPTVAYKMSDVLEWDLDFHRDLRHGDRFEVLYEDLLLDGEPRGAEAVLALVYENRGRVYEAYRYGEDGGYYDAEGQPLRKMFLRSPLPFSLVTSRFSHRRFHPVLKVHRPHYGVDYGAPTGTPARVTANGVVASAGWTKGGGKTVKVRHPNGYLTAYLHLSRYGPGIRQGKRVRQKDIIGYVGSTGLATGPHLDYRVQRNGRWIDPMKIPNTPVEPIPEAEMAAFLAYRDALRARLSRGRAAGTTFVGP